MNRRRWLLLFILATIGLAVVVFIVQRRSSNFELRPDGVTIVSKVTGSDSLNTTDTRFNVGGTDLGIIWDAGHDQVMIAFGDTFADVRTEPGGGPGSRDWRSNVLAFSADRNMNDGLNIDSMVEVVPGYAKELIHA